MPQPYPPVSGHGEALPLALTDLRLDSAGEPRVLDLDVADRLGFDRPRDVRDLIVRNVDELRRYGDLVEIDSQEAVGNLRRRAANSGETSSRGRGRPGRAFLLNHDQAMIVAVLSRAPHAADVRQQLVQVFNAWRAGRSAPVEPEPMPARAEPDPIAGMDHDDRLTDFDLAAYLGFAEPYGLRGLIARHEDELRERGELVRYSMPTGTRGRPRTPYLLNRAQCLFLAEVSPAPVAPPPAPPRFVNVLADPVRRTITPHKLADLAPPPPAAAPAASARPDRGASAHEVELLWSMLEGSVRLQSQMLDRLTALEARTRFTTEPRPGGKGRHRHKHRHNQQAREAEAIDLFIAGCTVEKADARVAAQVLFESWCEWCRVAGIKPGSVNWFGATMRARGFKWIKSSTVYYLGFDLLPSPSWSDAGLFDRDGGAA